MKTKEYCAHCGASVVRYNHSLNAGMVKGLILLEKAGGTSFDYAKMISDFKIDLEKYKKKVTKSFTLKVKEKKNG